MCAHLFHTSSSADDAINLQHCTDIDATTGESQHM